MRLAEIEGHIASMSELQNVVGAMRSLAGMRLREAQQAMPGIRGYQAAMAEAIGSALLLVPDPPEVGAAVKGPGALVLCMAEHGFVGNFNETLLEAARESLAPEDSLLVLGSRGAALVQESGLAIAWSSPMASRLEGTLEVIRTLAQEIYARIASAQIVRVEVLFARYRQGTAHDVDRLQLVPLDPGSLAQGRRAQAPLHNLAPERLLERLVEEYVFGLLAEAAVESLASENAARFAAMESAHDNVGRKLERLQSDARQARQTEITSELVDLVTGAEALERG
jgi:F-type H+-transporting ATPase subunit gamma